MSAVVRSRTPNQDPSQLRRGGIGSPINSDEAERQMTKPRVRVHSDGSFTIEGVDPNTFFSPGQPLWPQVQNPAFGAVGRRFDYRTLYNTQYTPRGDMAVGFDDLRALARGYDLLRTVIETRKDQMCALDWKISYIDPDKQEDDATKAVQALFDYPDNKPHRPFMTWMRECLEEVFVTDALAIYPTFTNSGKFHSLEQLDGTKFKPLIDAQGRTPDAPSPAYEQIIKGIPSVMYSVWDTEQAKNPDPSIPPCLLYLPRNSSVHSVYGYSPVEQIIVTVNIALRRQVFQLEYYRQGSIPDAIIGVPDSWTPENIVQLQEYWDAMFASPDLQNIAERRKMKFVPGGSNFKQTKEAILKDEFDEWLARVVCYAFSVEPTPFIKQMNRGTGETQKEQSREEGLLPLKKWWRALMNFIIQRVIERPDMQFVWDEDDAVDPKVASDIDVQEVREGIRTADEVRAERGLPPLPQKTETDPRMPTLEQVGDDASADPNAQAKPGAKGEAKPAAGDSGGTGAEPAKTDSKPGGNVVHIHVGKVLATAARKGMKVNAEYDVPYLFGISKDGGTLYRDKDCPQLLSVDGTPVDLDETCTVHELTEFSHCKDGDPYLQGHQKADEAEHALVAAQGVDPARYEQELQAFEDTAYAKGKSGKANTPPELATYPYESEGELALLNTAKMAKAAPKERYPQQVQRQRMARALKRELRRQAGMVKDAISPMLKQDGGTPEHSLEAMHKAIPWAEMDKGIPAAVRDPLKRSSAEAVQHSKASLGKMVKDSAGAGVGISEGFVDKYALDYADERGAEMVGMKWVDGELVPNPDAKWRITDETRDGINSLLTKAIEDGWSVDRFADELDGAYAFSGNRADVIARTETRLADSKGQLAGWKQSGVVAQKVWLVSNDGCCDDCQGNADDGPIDIDDDFSSGDDSPPGHPNCQCVVAPIVSEDEE
jgi:hypothetical protein